MKRNSYCETAGLRSRQDEKEAGRIRAYLEQGLFLDRKIRCDLLRLEQMRADLCSISPPRLDRDKVQSSPSGEASFAKALERLEQMEERISLEIDRLADLKAQIESVIRQLKHPGYQLVMICRYLEGRTWREIGDRMNRGETTVRTWHRNAIAELTLPENPIYL